METAQFHRAFWDYATNIGIGKIHYQPLGIIAFSFESGSPKFDVNLLNKDEISYYRAAYKKQGILLRLGVQIDRDVDVVRVTKSNNIFTFPELDLSVKIEGNSRWFRSIDGEWTAIENAPFVEYQRCDSLIFVN